MSFFVLLLVLLLTAGLLLANRDSGFLQNLSDDQLGGLLTLLPFALMLMAALFASRKSLARNLGFLSMWALIALGLLAGYQYRQELALIKDRLVSGLLPGHTVVTNASDGTTEVLLHRGLDNHFSAKVETNGASLSMMVDTGASSVVLTPEDAARAGIDPQSLRYITPVMTANGSAMAAQVRLKRVAIGPIVRENITALVTERGRLEQSLLGMSFLSTLDTIQIRADELRLRD
ncbi:retropepsin-like aspartic protease family protein [Allorhizobium undicola]|uniref:retropepsin-like aspartic protease family protein n=1 Tax=Allorhizobium undicola TaxID=78527 RepID=UPI00047F2F1E|nr:TIGR02281 family clan AA aspartic protease [Allorhizobium undicola]